MKSYPWRAVLGVLLGGAILTMILPGDRLQIFLESLSARVDGPGEARILVTLTQDGDRPFTFEKAISSSEIFRLRGNPSGIPRSDFVVEARKALAERKGYHSQTFGSENYKVMANVKVQTVEVKYPSSHRSETLFDRRMAQGGSRQSYLD